jgi:hypothetical protein
MKLALFALSAASLMLAQETSLYTRSTRDLNGNRLEGPAVVQVTSPTLSERTERLQSINGRLAPRERIEERVLRDDASGRVVERVVRRFDPNGNPGPPEKTLLEEQKRAGGSTVRTTTYRGDISGNMQLSERSVTEIQKQGDHQTANTVIERPTINGSVEAVEKKISEKTGTSAGYQETATTYRKGENGFTEAVRLVTSHAENNGQATDNAAEYEVGSSGRLELHGQTLTHTSRQADGSQVSEVDLFGASVPGTAASSSQTGLRLKEREIVERKPASGGTVLETTSVRRPSVSDPGVLGPARVISETVCRGKCP